MNDRDERYTYIYGGSVWYVEWDAEGGVLNVTITMNGVVKVQIQGME